MWLDRLAICLQPRNRGKWCRVWECDTSSKAVEAARNIRDHRVKLPEGRFNATARTVVEDAPTPKDKNATSKRFFVYAVYEGPDE